MSAHDAREALYRDIVDRRIAGDDLRERVATVARAMGIPAATLLVDLRAEAFGVA